MYMYRQYNHVCVHEYTNWLTTEGSIFSASMLGPSTWLRGELSLLSVLLSDEFMLVSFTLLNNNFAFSTYMYMYMYVYMIRTCTLYYTCTMYMCSVQVHVLVLCIYALLHYCRVWSYKCRHYCCYIQYIYIVHVHVQCTVHVYNVHVCIVHVLYMQNGTKEVTSLEH